MGDHFPFVHENIRNIDDAVKLIPQRLEIQRIYVNDAGAASHEIMNRHLENSQKCLRNDIRVEPVNHLEAKQNRVITDKKPLYLYKN